MHKIPSSQAAEIFRYGMVIIATTKKTGSEVFKIITASRLVMSTVMQKYHAIFLTR